MACHPFAGTAANSSFWRNGCAPLGGTGPYGDNYCEVMSTFGDTLIGFANRTQQWARDNPRMTDVAFVLVVIVLELIDMAAGSDGPGTKTQPDIWAVLLVLAGACTLLWRRQKPSEVLLVLMVVLTPFYVREYDSFMSIVGLSGFYAVAAHEKNRRKAWIVLTGVGVVLLAVAAFTLMDLPTGFDYSGAASMFSSISLLTFVGVIMRNREQIFVKAEARADQAEADRAATAERAVAEERLRIAREMHDVVAHGMSVIAVQASAAQEIAATAPDRAVELMRVVETTGRESLVEMRRMLGVLRQREATADAPEVPRGPQPTLADIETTIEHCRDAGLPTEYNVLGDPRPLSAGLELAVFRIVQEALTNVLKHGGSAATASVELSYRFTTLLVRVTDTGRGVVAAVHSEDAGNGLLGMRERVELYDGTLTTGPKPGGGYQVTAVLPLGKTSQGPRRAPDDTDAEKPVSAGKPT